MAVPNEVTLKILHVEHDPADAALVADELRRSGLRCEIVAAPSEADLHAALQRDSFDLVLADYSLPGWTGMDALRIVRERDPELPFILVTGTVGEEIAVEAMKHGATDYILKDKMGRLSIAAHRALGERELRVERRNLEAQLRVSQKMEAIGQLAGGIAHDFNNLLGIIMGYTELMLDKMPANDPQRRRAEEIRKASKRAGTLIQQLLAFARRQPIEPRVMNLNSAIQDITGMINRLLGEDITLVTKLADDLGRIKADPGQMEQVLINLAVNARDAMPKGGQLKIETSNTYLDEHYARSHVGVTPGHYVQLCVSDNGMGMDRETQARIFEPFFTTKGAEKGTGLGLATVYGIVKQFSGSIWVYSEVGQGTVFRVYLPREDQPASAQVAEVTSEPSTGNETILVSEDEESLRSLLTAYLSDLGYVVLEASDGNQALEIARRHEGPIDLLLTDIIMPGMSGRELARELAARHHRLKVLYLSGYSDDTLARGGTLEPGAVLMQKPFRLVELSLRIRDLLKKN